MSACAGSSIEASRPPPVRCRPKSLALARPGTIGDRSGAQEKDISSISPAWSRWIAPGRIRFMSTQRREDRWRLASCKDCAGSLGREFPGLPGRNLPANAAGRTAPPETPAIAATNSLPSDDRNQQPVRLLQPGSPPPRQASAQRQLLELPFGSPPIPFRAISAQFPSSLAVCWDSQVLPDGKVRWQKKFAFPARRMRRGLRF